MFGSFLLILLLSIPAAGQNYYPKNVAVAESGIISTGNVTTSNLGASGVYTGSADDVSDYSNITIFVYADAPSARDGLSMEFSSDGSNWDRKNTASVSSGVAEVHTLIPEARFFRIQYTNGSTAQTVFRLNAYYHKYRGLGFSSRASDQIGFDRDVAVVRLASNARLDVSRGLSSHIRTVNKFGRNSAVAAGTTEDIWENGGSITFPTSAEAVRVKAGGNAQDSYNGTGAASITVVGLDATWKSTSAVIATSGTIAGPFSTVDFIRVFWAYVSTTGTAASYSPPPTNAGDIVLENESSDVVGNISGGFGQNQIAAFTVAADETCYLERAKFQVSSNKPADVNLWQRRNANDTTAPFTGGKRIIYGTGELTGIDQIELPVYPELPAYTDIWASATAAAGSDAVVDVKFDLECIVMEVD